MMCYKVYIKEMGLPISDPNISYSFSNIFVIHLNRFDGFNSDNTYIIISEDKMHLQCRSTTGGSSHLCGHEHLNIPGRDNFTLGLLFKGATFRPTDGYHHRNDTSRNRYTWKATHYRVMGKMATCPWLGEHESKGTFNEINS